MKIDAIAKAVRKAIEGGAVSAPPVPTMGEDDNFVRMQTDVGVDPAIFDTYLAELKSDPELNTLDGCFANSPHGGGTSVGLNAIARLLLAQAIVTGDVRKTVEKFASYVKSNSARALSIVGVSGISINRTIKFGPHIRLVSANDLPLSMQRGVALGTGMFKQMQRPISCAFVTEFDYSPVFYLPKTPQPPEDMSAHRSVADAESRLVDAINLLSIFGVAPAYRMSWVHPADWLMISGIGSGWSSSGQEFYGTESQLQSDEVEAFANGYFGIEERLRESILRIPLDRLNRSISERDLADRAIDLGIALEALLLHGMGDATYRGELRYRFSLRGAWLIGTDAKTRAETQSALKALYDLRSSAVHAGRIPNSEKTRTILEKGAELCREAIKKVALLRCKVDWDQLVLG